MISFIDLEIINGLYQLRGPLLDELFKCLDFFDRQEFLFILIPAIWFGVGWKAGLRIFYILLLSALANHALKEAFLSPRPFHLDPTIALIHVKGYGFPSGAAQTSIFLGGLLVYFWKSRWKWVVSISYLLLISFSRLYLGVHFPIDILGGWLAGLIILMLFIYAYKPIERLFERLSPLLLLILSQLIPLLLLISHASIPICASAMGVGAGLWLSHHFQLFLKPPENRKERGLRIVIGIAGLFLCYTFTLAFPQSKFFLFSQFFLVGLWLSCGGHVLCRQLLRKQES